MGSGSQTTEQNIPQWQEDFLRQNVVPLATSIGQQSYTPYTGQSAADLGSYTTQAADMYGNVAGMSAADYGAMNQANMNPYIQNVIDPALAASAQQYAEARSGLQSNVAQSGAFGNNRRGVAEGQLAADYALGNNQMIANLYNQGYGNAQTATQAQIANQMAGAGALTGIGGTQTALQQTGLDRAYDEFMREQNLPYQQLAAMTGVGQGNYGNTQTTTQKRGLFDYLTLAATAAGGA